MRIGRQVRLGGLLVAGVALGVVVMFALGHSQAGTSQAGGTNGAMAVDCNYDPTDPDDPSTDAGIQSECTYLPGSSFNIAIHITQPPAGGYNSSQAKVEWADEVVDYLPTASAADEALAPTCTIPARSNNWEALGEPSVLFACTPFPAPDPLLTDTGAFLTFEFQCKSDPNALSPPAGLESNQSLLRLIPPAGDPQFGSHFTDETSGRIEPAPALTNATVTCGEVTVEPTATPPVELPGVGPGPEGEVSLTGGEIVIDVGDSTVLTFTVVDTAGNTVPNVVCTFSVVGPDGTDATLSSDSGTTNDFGQVSVTLTAGTTAETVQVKADCGDFGSFVQDVTVSPALPTTGAALGADSGFSVGLWAMIGALLVAAAGGLVLFGRRYARAR